MRHYSFGPSPQAISHPCRERLREIPNDHHLRGHRLPRAVPRRPREARLHHAHGRAGRLLRPRPRRPRPARAEPHGLGQDAGLRPAAPPPPHGRPPPAGAHPRPHPRARAAGGHRAARGHAQAAHGLPRGRLQLRAPAQVPVLRRPGRGGHAGPRHGPPGARHAGPVQGLHDRPRRMRRDAQHGFPRGCRGDPRQGSRQGPDLPLQRHPACAHRAPDAALPQESRAHRAVQRGRQRGPRGHRPHARDGLRAPACEGAREPAAHGRAVRRAHLHEDEGPGRGSRRDAHGRRPPRRLSARRPRAVQPHPHALHVQGRPPALPGRHGCGRARH